jgi:hypothetical protein
VYYFFGFTVKYSASIDFVLIYQLLRARLKRVKATLVQALRLCTDRTAHRGSRVVALL